MFSQGDRFGSLEIEKLTAQSGTVLGGSIYAGKVILAARKISHTVTGNEVFQHEFSVNISEDSGSLKGCLI